MKNIWGFEKEKGK